MIKPIITDWTIVILGHWNRAIFNPKWLVQNIFPSSEVMVEFNMEMGSQNRITSEKILIIPREDRLIISVTELSDDVLKKMEIVAVKLLDLLSHTPVIKTGVNFGFEVDTGDTFIADHFPQPDLSKFNKCELQVKSRALTWNLKTSEGIQLNLFTNIKESDSIHLKFNYEFDTVSTQSAKERIENRIIELRDQSKALLEQLYGLKD